MDLMGRIAAQSRAEPNKIAFIHNGVHCSYAEFVLQIAQYQRYFSRSGVAGGTVAVLCVDHLAQAWAMGIALRQLGLTTVNVGTTGDLSGLGLGNITCIVTWAPENPRDPANHFAGGNWTWINVPTDLSQPVEEDPKSALAGSATPAGHIVQTSGTTGAYKMVLRDAAVEASTLDLHAEINEIKKTSLVYVRDFPLWTAGGYRWPLLSWHQGATVVFQQWQDFQVPFFTHNLTHAFATPMTLMFALHTPEVLVQRNDNMRLLVTGGAMPRALVSALQARLTRQVYAVLASTEALTLGATRVDNLDDLAWHSIHPSREVQVVNDAHQPLPVGQIGLMRAKIPDGVNGYLGDKAASSVFFHDGYFYSGDLAVFRADGRLALCGRVTDVINVLGSKIATAPLEAALQNQLGVDAVCVLSLPHAGSDEQVHVAIECQQQPSAEELQVAAKDLLDTVGQVHFHFFTQLPRNRMGKVVRLALQQQLLGHISNTP